MIEQSRVGRGELYLKKGDLQSALADSNEALKLNSANINALVSRVETYRKLGKESLAKKDEKRILGIVSGGVKTLFKRFL